MTTITDRDLIAGAAAAIGLHWCRYDEDKLRSVGHSMPADMLWNPLTNRAHALELGVAIRAAVTYENACVFCETHSGTASLMSVVPLDSDAPAALCRALTELAYDVAQSRGAA